MNEIGKTEPITFMVGINDQGKVTEVVIMVFRENRGWEVKEKRFLNQFKNKTVHSPIRVEEDIINYTGATLSSKAVARGVKRALALVNALYLGRQSLTPPRRQPPASRSPTPISPLVSVDTVEGRTALYRQARYAMGTICEIRLWCASANEAQASFHSAFAEIERLEQIFSAYREDQRAGPRQPRSWATVQSQSAQTSSASLNTPSVPGKNQTPLPTSPSPHCSTPGASADDQPQQPYPARTSSCPRPRRLRQTHSRRTNAHDPLPSSGMQLDFGGLAKGYAAQRVAQLLHSRGVHAALVNLGQQLAFRQRAESHPTRKIGSLQETGIPFASLAGGHHISDRIAADPDLRPPPPKRKSLDLRHLGAPIPMQRSHRKPHHRPAHRRTTHGPPLRHRHRAIRPP